MAGKPRNRLELRRQYDAAEPLDPMEDEAEEVVETDDDEEVERKPKKKPKPKPKASTKAPKAAARMRIVWVVVNEAFKPVATFEYSQREAAEAKAAELIAKGKGVHFIQKSKEPMPEDAPGLGASIPRTAEETKPSKAAAAKPAPKAVEIPEIPEDDEDDDEDDEDENEDEGEGDDEE